MKTDLVDNLYIKFIEYNYNYEVEDLSSIYLLYTKS